jgi:serine protease Do
LALGFLVSLATGFLGGYLGSSHYHDASASTANITKQREIANNQGQLISSIAQTVGPSVVSVNVTTQAAPTSDFFGFQTGGGTEEAAGTGIIISSGGLIVTNRHVVPAGTTNVNVTLSDGTQLTNVTVIGRTSDNDSLDIAFLKINDAKGHKLTPAQIGDSGKMAVGDTAVAIGNALGQFSNTVTSGIISGFGRSVVAGDSSGSDSESLDDLIQTDAAINQGNSGGPLVNTDAQVVGINTAVSGQGQNIGFAIPINDVSGLIKQVLSTGKFERPYLGVRYVRITPDVQKQYNLSVSNGAFVVPSVDAAQPSVISGSPADKAGVKESDVITEIDGTKLDQSNSLTSLVGRHAVGDTVHLTVLRDGKTITLDATLQAMPQDNQNSNPLPIPTTNQ